MPDAAGDLARLKTLLLQPESRQLEVLQQQVRALDSRVGTRTGLEASTAEVLTAAFRRAETTEHHELARAVAPVVVAAIQSEIRNSRDMMVEALYPITGRLVAAAVSDAFRNLVASINERVDTMMSARLWRLRFKSWITRRPLSELLLAEATRPNLRRMLFLERGSGALIADWSRDAADAGNSDLVSGMIAAITEFSSNVFEHESGELRTIDMGASRLLLHASARSIVAAELAGPLHPQDEATIHARLARLAALHNETRTVDKPDLGEAAEDIMRSTEPLESEARRKPLGIWLVVLLLLALAGWYGWRTWTRSQFEAGIREAFATTVAARPALQAFPLSWRVDHGARLVEIAGLAPDARDAQALRTAVQARTSDYALAGDIAVIASQQSTQAAIEDLRRQGESLQSTLSALRGDIARMQEGVSARQEALSGAIDARAAEVQETLQETLQARAQEAQAEARRLATQLGALQAEFGPRVQLTRLVQRTAIFFEKDAVLRDPIAAGKAMDDLAALLKEINGGIRIVGTASESGTPATNQKLSQDRTRIVAQMLMDRGIPASHIVSVSRSTQMPIDALPDAAGTANRRVQFETLFDGERALP